MLDDTPWDDADDRIGAWQDRIEARASRVRALAVRLRELRATASSGGGLVRVTVDSGGALTALHLDDAVRRHSAPWIAEQVLAAFAGARAELSRQAERMAREDDSTEGRALLTALTDRWSGTGRRDGTAR
ncbi:YbaB/EbfC family nucleoid-associated protein [Actinoplanes sp. NPDC051851]|uniref:YbaB/EbfC family nucleoid-associated protein n=1 Tax=Actinoplanes sp. NPDC051851 TaxID=3154753 RepID=UPI003449A7E3